jgi:uncharacterized protein YecE (DUF72 family)
MFRVGTSGWSYDHWRMLFYPEKLPAKKRLDHYSRSFDTVEVNASFYHLPAETTFRKWKETVPDEFTFAVKASRYITHLKRLVEPEESLKLFLSRARLLGRKLGPVLFQLPPNWKVNPERLEGLLRLLPRTRRFAFEFRDPSWFTDEVEALLRERAAAFCIFHMAGLDCPFWVTAPFVYVRFHGSAVKYRGSYSPRELGRWAERVRGWLEEGLDVYAYFNNDAYGHAVTNSLDLMKRVGG